MCNNCVNEIKIKEYINIQTGEVLDLEQVSTLPDSAILKVRPDLWCEWDFEKNNELGFDIWKIKKYSNKKVWWICPSCRSSYDASNGKRVNNRNCPYCAGKRINHINSLFVIRPEQAKQWHPTKNGELTPHAISPSSPKKVWWKCDKCGSEWIASPNHRSKGTGCPYCAGRKVNHTNSLASINPELAKQWHPTKNKKTSHEYTLHSNQKVWWLGDCGHEWEAVISSRNRKDGERKCPYCTNVKVLIGFNDMWTTNPEQASWLLNPEDGYKYMEQSNKKLDWKCPCCNLIIKGVAPATVSQFGLVCHQCSTRKSLGEKIMNTLLQTLHSDYVHDKTTSWSNTRRYDFIIRTLNIIIETHGVQHFKETRRKGARTLEEEQVNDKYKYELAITNGILPENYIVIDCRYSDFEYIKNSIINSRLAEVFDLSKVDWREIFKSYNNPKAKDVCDDFNKGLTNRDKLAEKHGIHRSTVYQYLKKGGKIGWVNPNKNDA